MSHALATVRHDGRRPSVTPGTGAEKSRRSREAAKDKWSDDGSRLTARPQCVASITGSERSLSWGSAPGYESVAASRLPNKPGYFLGLTPQAIGSIAPSALDRIPNLWDSLSRYSEAPS